MIDLAKHIFDTANAMNKVRAEELRSEHKANGFSALGADRREEDVAPHIAKIPLRAEVRALEQAAQLYDANAAQHFGEAARLKILARQARECAENLRKMGDL